MVSVLFNIFFDIITKLSLQNHQQKGLPLLYHLGEQKPVGGQKKFTNELFLNNMAYANNMVLIAYYKGDLEEMLRSLDCTCSLMGLTVSTAKTKVLAILPSGQTEPTIPLTLHPGEGDILVVDTFAYLGCHVEKNCSIEAEVNSHIEKASRAFSLLNKVLWYKKGSAPQLSYVCSSSWCWYTDWIVQSFSPTMSDASKNSTTDVLPHHLGDFIMEGEEEYIYLGTGAAGTHWDHPNVTSTMLPGPPRTNGWSLRA